MVEDAALPVRELQLYVQRVSDRWPIERALASSARASDAAGLYGETGGERDEYVIVLVSQRFDGVPWLERIRQAVALWDAAATGGPADVHCYTPVELERKIAQLPRVRATVESGLDVLRS